MDSEQLTAFFLSVLINPVFKEFIIKADPKKHSIRNPPSTDMVQWKSKLNHMPIYL